MKGGDIAAVRRVLGVTLIVGVPPMAYLARAHAMGAIATLRDVQKLTPTPITNTDSATLSSAAYHAGHAMATMDGRWGPTGFMTVSAMAFALGCVLMAWPMLRRRAQ